ncbi:MAG: hypothetical protein L3J35_02535 [Bacteroidales bacterium]|nr:hypothetical protein [Bacteroidales bacterium]
MNTLNRIKLLYFKSKAEKFKAKKTKYRKKNNFDKAAKYRKTERKYLEKISRILGKGNNFTL